MWDRPGGRADPHWVRSVERRQPGLDLRPARLGEQRQGKCFAHAIKGLMRGKARLADLVPVVKAVLHAHLSQRLFRLSPLAERREDIAPLLLHFLAESERQLFAASLESKSSQNDADRLRKYLARFGFDRASVVGS